MGNQPIKIKSYNLIISLLIENYFLLVKTDLNMNFAQILIQIQKYNKKLNQKPEVVISLRIDRILNFVFI